MPNILISVSLHILGVSLRQKISPYARYGSIFVLDFHPRLHKANKVQGCITLCTTWAKAVVLLVDNIVIRINKILNVCTNYRLFATYTRKLHTPVHTLFGLFESVINGFMPTIHRAYKELKLSIFKLNNRYTSGELL